MTASALYIGHVRHRRMRPVPHTLRMPLFMLYLDLAELGTAFQGRWFWSVNRPNLVAWHRQDYLGPTNIPLDQAVRLAVRTHAGTEITGPIRMLAHPRFFGYTFNPVTFYYCFNAGETKVDWIVSEITNTPWKERHIYVTRGDGSPISPISRDFQKAFHVSPFMPMNQTYRWHFGTPAAGLSVHMQNFDDQGKIFDATLSLRRQPITTAALAKAIARFPFMPLQVLAGIYWNALLLKLKGVKPHDHPKWLNRNPATERTHQSPSQDSPPPST